MIFSIFGVKKSAFRLTARPSLAIGIAKVITFLETANFLKKFFQKILRSNDVKELFKPPPFPNGDAKVMTFSELPNLFLKNFHQSHFFYLRTRVSRTRIMHTCAHTLNRNEKSSGRPGPPWGDRTAGAISPEGVSYIMPPAGIAGAAGAGSGMSTIPHSVVRNMPATEAAFSRATRETLVGSITPASNMLT